MLKPSSQHHAEGADERDRHRGQRNDGRAPGLEENDHHNHHQQDRLGQRVNHGLDGMPHEDGGIVNHRIINALREVLFQFLHLGADIVESCRALAPGDWKMGMATADLLFSSERSE
jgi:hypothetical protein